MKQLINFLSRKQETADLEMKVWVTEECSHRLRFQGKRDARRAPRAD